MLSALVALSLTQDRVEVPFRLGEDAIIVDAALNGRTLSFMFDTGFGGSFVVDNKISLGKATGKMTLRDFVGEFQADTVKLNTVQLGSRKLTGNFEAVMQPADYSFSYNTHCDGIMGFEPIMKEITEINFENKKFIFHPKSHDITKRVPDNKKTFLLKMLPLGTNSVEMEVIASTGKKMVLALDTGNAFYATTHRDVLERVGEWKTDAAPRYMTSAMVASGPVDSWYKKMKDVTIFGVKVPESYWSIIDLPSSSAEGDGTVGFGFLKNFNVTIDYERRRVWLENFSGSVGNEPIGKTGLAAIWHESTGRVRVANVSADSPAHSAGIKRGDTIISINGKEMLGAIGYRELEAILDGKPGSKVSLAISSGGDVKRIELERKALIND